VGWRDAVARDRDGISRKQHIQDSWGFLRFPLLAVRDSGVDCATVGSGDRFRRADPVRGLRAADDTGGGVSIRGGFVDPDPIPQRALDLRPVEPSLVFEPIGHTYHLQPQGIELPSVTTVLKETRLIDYSMIPQDVLQNAARRGTAVHQALALLDEEALDEETVDPEIRGYIEAYLRFKRESGFEPALIEYRSWSPVHRYAGTLDRTGTIGNDNVLLDFKTGMVMAGHRLQLAAYQAFLPDPLRLRRIALQLKGDGTYRVHEFPDREYRRDLSIFLGALAVVNFMRAGGK
jgi:hypothetical protein